MSLHAAPSGDLSAHRVGQTAIDQGYGVALAVALSCGRCGGREGAAAPFRRTGAVPVSRTGSSRRRGDDRDAALVGVVALGASRGGDWTDHQRERLLGTGGIDHTDQRKRLVDLGNNGRTDAWRVAGDAFAPRR